MGVVGGNCKAVNTTWVGIDRLKVGSPFIVSDISTNRSIKIPLVQSGYSIITRSPDLRNFILNLSSISRKISSKLAFSMDRRIS